MEKKKKSNKKIALIVALVFIVGMLLGLGVEIGINFSISPMAERPENSIGSNLMQKLLFYFENPDRADEDDIDIDNEYIIEAITPVKEYIDGRYDCIDFRMQSLMRLEYLYGDQIAEISPQGSQMIKESFLNAKYWMTEPGEDSICFWSENHQILFASAEYLAGQRWPNEIFTNDNSTGLERMQRGKNRLNYWMEHRFKYGFSEFNSNNYYHMNLGAAANFIQFAAEDDDIMVERMKICLDLLFHDVASNMYDYTFIAPSGRAYSGNMASVEGDRMRQYIDYLFGFNDDHEDNLNHMFINFKSMMEAEDSGGNKYYEVPEVIKEIAQDNSTRIIKSSSSLDVSELEEKNLISHSDDDIMLQMGMEAFTNPEVIQNTITYLSRNKMLSNSFLNQFKYINLSFLKTFKLLRPISNILNPMPNGIAIQRANIYTYRNEYYKLSTAQAYHPGSYGAQQMLSVANMNEYATIFTTHPAKFESKKSVDSIPGYWAGFGRAPHSAQHENILMSIYQLPQKKNPTEFYDVPKDFTHTYFPEAFMDEVIIDNNMAFGRVGGAYIALIGASELEYLPFSMDSALVFKNGLEEYPDKGFDLMQRGENQFWIYEMSDESEESFEDFKTRIKENSIDFDGEGKLLYNSKGHEISLKFGEDFKIDGNKVDFDYKRFDSDYITANRESEEFVFELNSHKLILNFQNAERTITYQEVD